MADATKPKKKKIKGFCWKSWEKNINYLSDGSSGAKLWLDSNVFCNKANKYVAGLWAAQWNREKAGWSAEDHISDSGEVESAAKEYRSDSWDCNGAPLSWRLGGHWSCVHGFHPKYVSFHLC
jgi:hypothetical protein